MKILHFSKSLPDIRPERFAKLDKMLGHKPIFLGILDAGTDLKGPIFERSIDVAIKPKHLLGFSKTEIITQIKDKVSEIDPDLIHAHNLHFMKLIDDLNLGIPAVHNSHEYWSVQVKYHISLGLNLIRHPKNFISSIIERLKVPRWERDIINRYPTIVVSKEIQSELMEDENNDVHVIPNYPVLEEVENVEWSGNQSDYTEIAYLGNVTLKGATRSYLDVRKMYKTFNDDLSNEFRLKLIGGDQNLTNENKSIIGIGRIPHLDCYKELSMSTIGLHGYPNHDVLQYSNPNKVFLYLHAGLIPMLPNNMVNNSLSSLKNIAIGYDKQREIIRELRDNKEMIENHNPIKIREIAKKNYILDPFKEKINQIYTLAIEKSS